MGIIKKTPSAYEYQLLLKHLLFTPINYDPNQEIIYKGTQRYTYREFRERVKKLAQALLDRGVQPGDTVAVMDYDTTRYLECYFAIPMIGAVLHTINIRLSNEQLIYTIDHAEDTIILVNNDFIPLVEQIRSKLDTVKEYILLTDTPEQQPQATFSFADEYEHMLQKTAPLEEFPDFDENTVATTFYTTGTTGLPKGVYFSHRQLVLHAFASISTLATHTGGENLTKDDVYMPITPMFHVHAWSMPYIATLLGIKQIYPGKYAPELLLKLIADEKVTFSHCVPTVLHMLLKTPSSASVDLSKWKVIIGGAALPKALCIEALKRGIDIFAGYGMSETCPIISISQPTHAERALPIEKQAEIRSRTGKPITLVQWNIVDPNNKPVPADDRTCGEILVRAPWFTQGYYKDTKNSEKLWQGGWLHTNDVACVKEDTSMRIIDRLKDVIKIGGEWVSSLEIEDVLLSHPAVAEAALIGKQDLKWGEIPFALIVLKPDESITDKALINYAKKYVERGALPKESILLKIQFVKQLEKTGVGKINKTLLREKYAEQS